jgi:PadR family transcriptional regulator PadR
MVESAAKVDAAARLGIMGERADQTGDIQLGLLRAPCGDGRRQRWRTVLTKQTQSAGSALAMHQDSRYKGAMRTKRANPDFLNGVPELLILSLISRCPMYGYELVQAIRQSTSGTLEFGEGCVYPVLHHLEADGMLASKRETVAGRSRVIYRVTSKGSKRLASTASQWQQIAQAINHVLQGGEHGRPALVQ